MRVEQEGRMRPERGQCPTAVVSSQGGRRGATGSRRCRAASQITAPPAVTRRPEPPRYAVAACHTKNAKDAKEGTKAVSLRRLQMRPVEPRDARSSPSRSTNANSEEARAACICGSRRTSNAGLRPALDGPQRDSLRDLFASFAFFATFAFAAVGRRSGTRSVVRLSPTYCWTFTTWKICGWPIGVTVSPTCLPRVAR